MLSIEQIKREYANGYSISETVSFTGGFYKILAVIVLLSGVLAGWMSGGGFGVSLFFGALISGAILYGMGVLVQAIAETLKAVLDTAAHTRVSAQGALERGNVAQ